MRLAPSGTASEYTPPSRPACATRRRVDRYLHPLPPRYHEATPNAPRRATRTHLPVEARPRMGGGLHKHRARAVWARVLGGGCFPGSDAVPCALLFRPSGSAWRLVPLARQHQQRAPAQRDERSQWRAAAAQRVPRCAPAAEAEGRKRIARSVVCFWVERRVALVLPILVVVRGEPAVGPQVPDELLRQQRHAWSGTAGSRSHPSNAVLHCGKDSAPGSRQVRQIQQRLRLAPSHEQLLPVPA